MPRTNSTAALAAKFAPEAGLEAEVAAMLAAAGASNAEALAEAEESLALNVSPPKITQIGKFVSSVAIHSQQWQLRTFVYLVRVDLLHNCALP